MAQKLLMNGMNANDRQFDAIELLQRLIACESCDPPGNEIHVARLVHDQFLAFGIQAELDEFLPGRANVLGRIRGTREKSSLVLSAHLDTVPVGAFPWSFGPFSGAIRDGRVLGRGASDMKGAVVAMIGAAVQINQRHAPLKGDILLAFSAGESSDCLGAKRFVSRGIRDEMGALLVGEPSSMDVVIVEKAALWLRVRAEGRTGHVSGNPGINAIDAMTDFLRAAQSIQFECPPHPLLDGPTLRVGRISGGSAVNLTPDICLAEIDIRLPPNIAPGTAIEKLRQIAAGGIFIETIDFKPAVESDPGSPFVSVCVQACESMLGKRPDIKGVSYYSDAVVLSAGLDIPFAIVGPGDLGMSGQPNESVSIERILAAARVYEQVADQWLS